MINEFKLNVKMFHLMENGFFGKQLLNEQDFGLDENMRVRIFQSMHNFWNDGNSRILVDGIAGDQTNNAITLQLKNNNLSFDKNGLSTQYQKILNGAKDRIANLKNINDIHNLRMLQVILCLSGRTDVKPDGVLGTVTKDAMKEKLETDNIAQVDDAKFKALIDVVINNVKNTNLTFTVKGGTVAGAAGAAGSAGSAGSSENNKSAGQSNEEVWKNYPCITQAKGIRKILEKDGTVSYQDEGRKNIYYGNGRKYNYETNKTESFFCDGGKVVIGGKNKDEKEINEYKQDFANIVNIAKGYYFAKYGTYKMVAVDKVKNILRFYNSMGEVVGYMGDVRNVKGDSEIYLKLKNLNALNGCWQYFPESKGFYLFNCSSRGAKLTNNNSFFYKA